MNDRKKAAPGRNGLGTGYVSVIMIFVVICLTTLAALSFSAAGSNSGMSEKSRKNMSDYYSAECRANRTLMQIDCEAADALESKSFVGFESAAGQIEGVTMTPAQGGWKAVWSVTVNDRLTLSCGAMFYEQPELHGGKRYEITEWETVSAEAAADAHINVWDGTF